MSEDTKAITESVSKVVPKFHDALEEVHKVIVGQKHLVKSMFVGLLADGHLLVEGVPGLAKTMAVNTLSKVISCDFKRIQFTPDLLPADLTGTTIFNQAENKFVIRKGPIFTNILLADEINRAPPKVQSALLEVMQERQVTIGGTTYETGKPFMVMATQNPIELEGTYILPEAQTDRFMMKVLIDYPSKEEEKEIMSRMGKISGLPGVESVISADDVLEARNLVDKIYIDDKVVDYILDVVFATRAPAEYGVDIEGLLQFGASPRASLSLQIAGKAHAFLEGRGYVTPQDIKSIGPDILRHRLRRSYEAEAEGIASDDILDRIFSTIQVP
jgi:MoxR-like ATPase